MWFKRAHIRRLFRHEVISAVVPESDVRAEVDIKEGMGFDELLARAASAVGLPASSPSDLDLCMVFPSGARYRVHGLDVIEPGRPLEVSLRDGGAPTVSD